MTPRREAFLRLLAWRPTRAPEIVWWYLTGRRVRARNRLRAAIADAPFAYRLMIRQHERQAALAGDPLAWAGRPLFSILAVEGDAVSTARATAAALRQDYDRWELLVGPDAPPCDDPRVRRIDGPPGLAAAMSVACGAYVVPLAPGDILADAALSRIADAVRADPGTAVVYGDEDRFDAQGRRVTPWFKPRWNAEMILALDFVSRACALRRDAARAALDDPAFRDDGTAYGLVLAATRDAAATVVHIPYVVTHAAPRTIEDGQAARVRAVATRVEEEGGSAEPGVFGTVTVRWPMPDPAPAVTILVPTRDRVELVRACVDGLLAQTRYLNYTVVIIDNGSTDPATLNYFAEAARDPRVRVLPCAMPYNFSAINNDAVARTSGDYLCFLNNDTEVIDGDWLGELMRYAVRPGIGAVGAQLLYEDRSIQHAGVVIGLGDAAGHAHRGLKTDDPGYYAQAYAAHYASAVTAACLVVERAKFIAVGGFDAEQLEIAYNDVDLCLKLNAAGWRTIYAPQAKLLHLESRSRGADLSSAHIERYRRELAVLQARWGTATVVDPLHHPLLDRGSETYRPSL